MRDLVIAEKPSVAQSIAKVLGATGRKDGYLENETCIISWCVGHLVELASADAYDPRYAKWEYGDLPILPRDWKYTISPATKKQFAVLHDLLNRQEVGRVINACDAGREGELIFRLVYHQCGCSKPVKRLWISSMEDEAIRTGFTRLLDGQNYDTLYEAALCRAKADWLVGINATRLFSCLHHKTLNVGRVVTPTLALLAGREKAIAGFQKEKFYTVELDCGGFRAASGRFSEKAGAQKVRAACLGKTAVVQSVKKQERREKPPKLFDLTLLQREANRLFGYTAQQTLDYAQSLYEGKLATYPRTDSNYLTGDMEPSLPSLAGTLADCLPFLEKQDFPLHPAAVIDSSKVSDHHAILPTGQAAQTDFSALPTGERNLLTLLCVRLLCALGEPHLYEETEAAICCGDTVFAAKGRAVTGNGWKAIWQAYLRTLRQKPEEEMGTATALPPLAEGMTFSGVQPQIREGVTTPPKRYTENSLLLAMETAGAEDFAQLEDIERKGLGTPATRAGVIEKLVRGGFVERKGRQMLPTPKGIDLISVLPDTVKSAKLTADWEAALKEVERAALPPEDFLSGIEGLIKDLVRAYQGVTTGGALFREAVGKCPRCGRSVYEGQKSFYCAGYSEAPPCSFALWKNNRFFTDKQKVFDRKLAAAFLKTGRVKMEHLYSEKKNRYYDAVVVMQDTGEKFVQFKLEFQKSGGKG